MTPDEIIEVFCGDKVIKVCQKPVEPLTKDPVRDANWEQLQALVEDDSHPSLQMRASQRMTELVAARVTGRAKERPLFNRIKIGSETVLLDNHEVDVLRSQYGISVQAITQCRDHDRKAGIKCGCLQSFVAWYHNLQRQNTSAPIALAAGNLWDELEAYSKNYERPKEADPTVAALIQALDSRTEAENWDAPSWFGRRSEKAILRRKGK
jgi:hypothetical protein